MARGHRKIQQLGSGADAGTHSGITGHEAERWRMAAVLLVETLFLSACYLVASGVGEGAGG